MAGASHIADVMNAVRDRIRTLKPLFDPLDVEIGHPAQFNRQAGEDRHLITLFVYRIKPDHRAMLSTPETGLAVELHVLATVYGGQRVELGESIGSLELRILSHIIRLFVEETTLGPVRVREMLPSGPLAPFVTEGVTVQSRLTAPEMEEINHIWTTQGDTPYRTSVNLVFSYALVVPLQSASDGPPVLTTDIAPAGGATAPGDIGVTPDWAVPLPVPVSAGALVIRTDGPAPALVAQVSKTAGTGRISVKLLGVTDIEDDFDLLSERFDLASGAWVPATASVTRLRTLSQRQLAANALPSGTVVRVDNPGVAAVIRFRLVHPTRPESFAITPALITVEVAP